MKKDLYCVIMFLIIGLFSMRIDAVSAQSLDYSKVKAESLSDDQILQMITRAEEQGLTPNEMYDTLTEQGMSSSEVLKLRSRVNKIRKEKVGNQKLSSLVDLSEEGRSVSKESDLIDTSTGEDAQKDDSSRIFGSSLFNNGNIKFEPNLNIPTPSNYIVGTGDQLLVELTGDNEASYKLPINAEGTIRVEYVGIVEVAGLTIDEVKAKLFNRFVGTYPSLRSGRTNLSLSLGNIRSIKIILTGFVTQPGTYTLPSVASVFNALYAAGGPSDKGTFRNIQIIRIIVLSGLSMLMTF
ncbi:polysaccharide biosynthesis/export family protein [Sphingobacterium populi]|uniref:polysaccharide biosynthesis/export family protein n=1 Tax=Sphingobacterium sp. CFCC 11742 TaxID=1775560 RepID=UPI00082B4A98|nr:polysaccharide biosynthesis/export family protein [Sphingobacterium sp. CFCC 11742]